MSELQDCLECKTHFASVTINLRTSDNYKVVIALISILFSMYCSLNLKHLAVYFVPWHISGSEFL